MILFINLCFSCILRIEFFVSFYSQYAFGVSFFYLCVMFYSLFYFIIDALITVDIGLWMHIHMIIGKYSPFNDQKYE